MGLKEKLDNKDQFDLNFYQEYLSNLYSRINRKRRFEDYYGYLDRNLGYLGKLLLKKEATPQDFILPLSWLFSLSTGLDINVQEAFIGKYPGVCPYCLEKQCVCYKTNKRPLKNIPAFEMDQEMKLRREELLAGGKVINLDWSSENIADIFLVNEPIWYIAGPYRHSEKIHQEIAEIHEAFTSYQKKEKKLIAVASEVADVFAWVLAGWSIVFPGKSLDDSYIDYYRDGCPICGNEPCTCGEFDSRLGSLVDFNEIEDIQSKVKDLAESKPSYGEELAQVLSSFGEALKTQNEAIAKVATSEAKDIINTILRGIDPEDTQAITQITRVLNDIEVAIRLDGVRGQVPMKKYDVFLSYSVENKDEARMIFDHLSGAGLEVFMSEKSVNPGAQWQKVIKDALKTTENLVVLVSPSSLSSTWVNGESYVAWGLDRNIFPILFQVSENALPEILKNYQAINFHEIEKLINQL